MSLQVLPATYEDMSALNAVEQESYNDSPLDGFLFKKAEDNEGMSEQRVELYVTQWKEDPCAMYFKVVDTAANGEIIAMAMYRLYTQDRVHLIRYPTADEVPSLFGDSAMPPASEFFGNLWAGRKRCIGKKPHIILQKLSTAPKHQRRGAGGMLVKKGCDIADELGIEAVLEASPEGLPLYKKYGYVEKEDILFDPKRYGREAEVMKTVCMVREPVVKSRECPNHLP